MRSKKKKREKRADMKKRKILFILTTTLVLLIAAMYILFYRVRIPEGAECRFDFDCVKQQITCCSCQMGGLEECVPKSKIKEFQQKLADCPHDLICPAVYNCKEIRCACVNGKCVGK